MTLEEIKAKKQYWRDTRVSGVYFLFDREELIYIGSSCNCLERMRIHRKDKNFDSYYIIETLPGKREELEAEFIRELKPPLNKVIPEIHIEPSEENTKNINKITVKDAVNFNYKEYVLEQEKIIRGKR